MLDLGHKWVDVGGYSLSLAVRVAEAHPWNLTGSCERVGFLRAVKHGRTLPFVPFAPMPKRGFSRSMSGIAYATLIVLPTS